MKNRYSVPSGYDGSRFRKEGDEIQGIEDKDYTLSVDGIPTSYGAVKNHVYRTKSYRKAMPQNGYPSNEQPSFAENGREYESSPTDYDKTAHENTASGYDKTAHKNTASDYEKTSHESEGEYKESPFTVAEKKSLFESPFIENGDLLLILLIFILSNEGGNEDIVPLIALLLCIR